MPLQPAVKINQTNMHYYHENDYYRFSLGWASFDSITTRPVSREAIPCISGFVFGHDLTILFSIRQRVSWYVPQVRQVGLKCIEHIPYSPKTLKKAPQSSEIEFACTFCRVCWRHRSCRKHIQAHSPVGRTFCRPPFPAEPVLGASGAVSREWYSKSGSWPEIYDSSCAEWSSSQLWKLFQATTHELKLQADLI